MEIQKDFFIRSLVPLWEADKNLPDVKLLKARAYLYLNRRPEALHFLKTTTLPEEKALLHYANANLTDQKDQIEKIDAPLKKMMAKLEYYCLEAKYVTIRKHPDVESILKDIPESWRFLFTAKLLDQDPWAIQSNILLKDYLDKEYPIDGLTMKEQYSAAAASNQIQDKELEFELLYLYHIKKALQSSSLTLVSGSNPHALTDYDYLLLNKAIGEFNLLKTCMFYKYIQGRPEAALDLVNFYLSHYQGHPMFHMMKSFCLFGLLTDRKPKSKSQKIQLLRQIIENCYTGLWWFGEDDRNFKTSKIKEYLNVYGKQAVEKKYPFAALANQSRQFANALTNIYPSPQYFSVEERLQFIHDEFNLFYAFIAKGNHPENSAKLLSRNKDRFKGNPYLTNLFVSLAENEGTPEKIPALYREGIKNSPLSWNYYALLASHYVQKGEFNRANDLFMTYPPFKEPIHEYGRVQLSSQAYFAGNLLFWKGTADAARTFFRISAGLDTGSGASLASQVKLSLIDRDIPKACEYSLMRAKRYNDMYGYTDYMSLLHLLEQSEVAWPLFDSLIGKFSDPHIWSSAFIGHRINNTQKEDFRKWLINRERFVDKRFNYRARFALLSLIDRKPSVEDVKFIGEIERPQSGWPRIKESPKVKKLFDNDTFLVNQMESPLLSYKDKMDLTMKMAGQEHQPYWIERRYMTVGYIYTHLKQRSYEKAFEIFKKLAFTTNFLSSAGRQFLPYLVFAAEKSGNGQILDAMLSKKIVEAGDYDMTLAWAVLDGLKGQDESSLELFESAFNIRPHKDNRLFFPWHQLVEMLEWIYLDTGKKEYLDLALKWSQQYQVIQPMFAWAFSFEAKYTDNPAARRKALAYAQHLDKQSEWISHFSDEDKLKAANWFKKNVSFDPSNQPVTEPKSL